MSKDKQRNCGPCCHNGHGIKRRPIVSFGGGSYLCWLESCKKNVAWMDSEGRWHYDPCDHVERDIHGNMLF